MRGNPAHGGRHSYVDRRTPAHAGQSGVQPARGAQDAANPRPCGAGPSDWGPGHRVHGKKPPVRGGPGCLFPESPIVRQTPAVAGRPSADSSALCLARANPRPCGATRWDVESAVYGEGEPPPMRGDQFNRWARMVDRGRTPAHAGRPAREFSLLCDLSANPRPCGATLNQGPSPYPQLGEPPPMRGDPLWVDIPYSPHSVDGAGFFHPRGSALFPSSSRLREGAVFSVSLDSGLPRPGGAVLDFIAWRRRRTGIPPPWRAAAAVHIHRGVAEGRPPPAADHLIDLFTQGRRPPVRGFHDHLGLCLTGLGGPPSMRGGHGEPGRHRQSGGQTPVPAGWPAALRRLAPRSWADPRPGGVAPMGFRPGHPAGG